MGTCGAVGGLILGFQIIATWPVGVAAAPCDWGGVRRCIEGVVQAQQLETYKVSLRWISAVRTNRTCAVAAIAAAAFPRMCSGTDIAAQRISPEQPLRESKVGDSQTTFSPQGVLTIGSRTELHFMFCSRTEAMRFILLEAVLISFITGVMQRVVFGSIARTKGKTCRLQGFLF